MATHTKDDPETQEVHAYSINARKTLNVLVLKHDVKVEWLAKMCHVTPQAFGHYLSGSRPIPMHVAALTDLALGGNDMLLCMASMEGITAMITGEAS